MSPIDIAICTATYTAPDGKLHRCWLEPDHTDEHLAIDRDTATRIRWRSALEPNA